MGTIFHLDIVSAEESIYSGPVEFLVAPAQMGEVGIYPRHTPMLTRIKSGMVRIKAQLKEEELIYTDFVTCQYSSYSSRIAVVYTFCTSSRFSKASSNFCIFTASSPVNTASLFDFMVTSANSALKPAFSNASLTFINS